MKKTFYLAALLLIPTISTAGSVITLNKNEMTGELTQAYVAASTNQSRDSFTVTCEPEYGLSFKFCYQKYEYLPDSSCYMSFDYKFDDQPIEKYSSTYDSDLKRAYAAYIPFLQKVTQHNKLIIAPNPDLKSMPTPAFNIADFKQKIKQFPAHCQLDTAPENPKPTTPHAQVKQPDANYHTHDGKGHSHPLPAQGLNHKHGNSSLGEADN